MIGQTISHYRILEKLGSGGMGAVYKAQDLQSDRFVELRLLPEEFARDKEALDRLQRNVQAASSLNHPNIRTIYEVGQSAGQVFIATELLEGQTLGELIASKPLDTERVLDVSVQVADALDALSSRGFVHSEINPANIFVTKEAQVKVLDFGLANIVHELGAYEGANHSRTGIIRGTPMYMSPEQLRGQTVDTRSDLFSFGAVIYTMVTGKNPFERDDLMATLDAVINQIPVPPHDLNPNLPVRLQDIISRAIEKDPDQRYQNAAEVRADLKRLKRQRAEPERLKWEREPVTASPAARSRPLERVGGTSLSRRVRPKKKAEMGPPDVSVIRVLYATDRQVTGRSEPKKFFANERAENRKLTLGVCEISIPESDRHKIGKLEKPSILRLEFSEDPAKHVILLNVQTKEEQDFFAELQQRVERSERKEAFVFVHGYDTTFEDAVRRTGQFACDLQFDGAPILYSWPSCGKWWKYAADETNVAWSVPHLESFLALIARSGARTVHLIAHSMGNRVLTSALELLVAKKALPPGIFRHIVLTAPDIDSETFNQLAAVIAPAGERLTMYSNYRDRALLLSKLFHFYKRAGSTIVLVHGMDTIDASRVDTSLTRHSYFGSSRTVLADLSSLLSEGKPPSKRFGMRERRTAEGPYYLFRP
jgi:esterase/lipase superfamily enzyme